MKPTKKEINIDRRVTTMKRIIHKRAVQGISYTLCTGREVQENFVSSRNAKVTCTKCRNTKKKTQSHQSWLHGMIRTNGGYYS